MVSGGWGWGVDTEGITEQEEGGRARNSMISLFRLPKLQVNIPLRDFRQLGLQGSEMNPETDLPILQIRCRSSARGLTC